MTRPTPLVPAGHGTPRQRWQHPAGRLLLLVVALVATGFSLASSATAGVSHPPVTNGYVNYQAGTAALSCTTAGSPLPVSISYQFAWDARGLHGSYGASVSLQVLHPNTGGGLTAVGSPETVPFPVAAGSTGQFSHSFLLAATTAGDVYQLSVNPTSGDTSDNYLATTGPIDCRAPQPETALAPTASISPLACDRSFTVTIDGRRASTTWGTTLIFQPGGFDPVVASVQPGHVTTVHIPGNGLSASQNYVILDSSASLGTNASQEVNIAAFPLNRPASCTPAPAATVSLARPTVQAGSQDTVTGHGFQPGETVTAVLHSTPLTIGKYTTNTAGTVSFSFTVPRSIPAGQHSLTLTGQTSHRTASAALTISAASTAGSGGNTGGGTGASPVTTTPVLANTGSPTAPLLALAGGLLVVGGGCLYMSRRISRI